MSVPTSTSGSNNRLVETVIVLWAMVVARPRLLIGGLAMAIGATLLLGAVAYVGLDLWGRAQLDDLTVPESTTGLTPEDLLQDLTGGATEGLSPTTGGSLPNESEGVAQPSEGAMAAARCGDGWDFNQLRMQASAATGGSAIGSRFTIADWSQAPLSVGRLPKATRIIIPAIGLDSRIEELSLTTVGDEYQWQTADHAVGHHKGSPNPGERGNAVYSGHINSPVRGEGAIFARLPEVACLLKNGQIIDVILETETTRYLYRVTSTDAQKPEDVNVFRKSDLPTLSLVTCWPRTSYNYRFIVNALLVGTAPLESA
jgi:LPXTG-site transpeptidase (sortase) family protein